PMRASSSTASVATTPRCRARSAASPISSALPWCRPPTARAPIERRDPPMSRLTTIRSTLAASALAILLAVPALAALPPGLTDNPPAAQPPAAQPPAAQPPAAQPPAAIPQDPAPPAPAPARTPGGGQMVFDPDFQVQNRSRTPIIML